ncbi:MAG: hypothetical protein ABSB94_20420 [Syntrophorhabdales bacterium]
MKRMFFALSLTLSLAAAMPASADTLAISGINSLVYGQTQYGGEYVGPIGASLNGNAINGGINCVDISTSTDVPTSYPVTVSTLSPLNLNNAKFAGPPSALFEYQEAAWLFGQMPSNQSEVGAISFAIWSIFSQNAYQSHGLTTGQQADVVSWLAKAQAINVANYNFSSVQIYTAIPASSNQEFMSGAATPVPLPSALLLLGPGFLGLVGIRRKYRT